MEFSIVDHGGSDLSETDAHDEEVGSEHDVNEAGDGWRHVKLRDVLRFKCLVMIVSNNGEKFECGTLVIDKRAFGNRRMKFHGLEEVVLHKGRPKIYLTKHYLERVYITF